LGQLFVWLNRKWYVDELYELIIIRPYVVIAGFLAEVVDWRFWHDWFHDTVLARSFRRSTQWLATAFDLPIIDGAANGLGDLVKATAGRLRQVQTGYVRNYAISLFVGLILMLSYLLIR
jgi:NADH-quinone oxidoreductase subunit L